MIEKEIGREGGKETEKERERERNRNAKIYFKTRYTFKDS